MDRTVLTQIGKRIRRSREQLNLTREQFAEQVQISPQFLAELENGKKGMSADTLYKICQRFRLSADYMLFGEISSVKFSNTVNNVVNTFPEPYVTLVEEVISAIGRVAMK